MGHFFFVQFCVYFWLSLQFFFQKIRNIFRFLLILFQISKGDFSPIFRADFDDIKTVCGSESCPFTVLISSKSVAKIGEKSTFDFFHRFFLELIFLLDTVSNQKKHIFRFVRFSERLAYGKFTISKLQNYSLFCGFRNYLRINIQVAQNREL